MKGFKAAVALMLLSLSLFGCERGKVHIAGTYEKTDASLVESFFDEGEIVTTVEYYELSDGSYRTESGHSYKYRLVIEGRMHLAARDSTYVVLSNSKDITFDQAWKAAGYSSNLDDYFNPEDAVIVGIDK